MKRLAAVFLLVVLPAAAQKRPVTHEDIFLLKRTGEPVVSPDGKWAVYSLTEPDYDPARFVSDLWIVATDGSAPARRLTTAKGTESSPVWSPDSRRIAFSARRDGDEAAQIYLLPLEGGESQKITSISTGAAKPKWRPDGKAILFESSVKPGTRNPGKSSARVYDAMPVRFWNVWLDGSLPHIFVQTIGASTATDIASGQGVRGGLSAEATLHAEWSPDGSEIVYAALVGSSNMMRQEVESQLFRVPASGGTPKQITAAGSSYSSPQFSPDGKFLYALQERSATADHIYSLARLVRMNWPDASSPASAFTDFDRSISNFSVSPDSKSLVLVAESEGFSQLYRVPSSGGKPERLFPVREGGYTNAQFAAGGKIVATYSSSTQPAEIARIEGEKHVLLTNANAGKLAQLDMPTPFHFWFTAKNGKRIHSILVPPPGLDSSKKYPILVFPHGGPNAMSADAFSTRWNYHLLTSPGYALLMTNYTGSTGFGEAFADDIERDVLRGPAREILEAVDAARSQYTWLDGERQCAIGASYGGYLMNWFNGHTRQFKCMVNHAGAVNNESQYGTNDGGLSRELRMGAPVWQTGKGQWMDQSPFRYAAEWRTPTLITQGELDYRVPVGESLTTFKLLQRQGIPARLMVFPDEGHWILKGENNRHHMQEVLAWLKQHLGN